MPGTGRSKGRLNRAGGFTYRFLWVCYWFLIVFSIGYSWDAKGSEWYSREVVFSDWRGVGKVDFATNAVVSNWYSGGEAKDFRVTNIKELQAALDTHKVLTVGIDYYGLTGVCSGMIPPEILTRNFEHLAHGGVVVVKVQG